MFFRFNQKEMLAEKKKKKKKKTQTDYIAGKPRFFFFLLFRSRLFGVLHTFVLFSFSCILSPTYADEVTI